MRAGRHEAKVMGEVAAIRDLQMRAAELEAGRAEAARRAAAGQLEEGRDELRAAERGWSAAMAGGRFDPALSGRWLHAVEARRTEERTLARAESEAAGAADAKRRALQAAQARAEATEVQARAAARTAARRRDEEGLAEIEDRFGARRRPA